MTLATYSSWIIEYLQKDNKMLIFDANVNVMTYFILIVIINDLSRG